MSSFAAAETSPSEGAKRPLHELRLDLFEAEALERRSGRQSLTAPRELKVFALDAAAAAQNQRALENVLELADVAWKPVREQASRHFHADPRARTDDVDSKASGSVLDEVRARRVERADTLFVTSRHPVRGADVSHRGGAPGFVLVVDAKRLRIPDYRGNSMFNTFGNFMASNVQASSSWTSSVGDLVQRWRRFCSTGMSRSSKALFAFSVLVGLQFAVSWSAVRWSFALPDRVGRIFSNPGEPRRATGQRSSSAGLRVDPVTGDLLQPGAGRVILDHAGLPDQVEPVLVDLGDVVVVVWPVHQAPAERGIEDLRRSRGQRPQMGPRPRRPRRRSYGGA